MAKKEYAAASLEFRNAINEMPKDAEAQYQLALSYLAVGDTRGAFTTLQKAAELDPKHAGVQLRLGALLLASSDERVLENARDRVQKTVDAAPENADALDLLAVTEFRLGNVENALQHLETAVQKFPRDVTTALNLAALQSAKKDEAGAEQTLKNLVTASPRSVPAALALARFYLRNNRLAAAEAEVRRAHQLNTKDPDALSLLAFFQIGSGHADQAEQTYRELAALPTAQFRTAYAVFLFRENKSEQGLAELERLAKREPNDRNVRSLLVSAYVARERNADAAAVLKTALARNAHDTDALLQRADLYLRYRQYREAEQDIRSVLHFLPGSAEAHYALSKIYGRRGVALNQQQEISEALRQNPELLPARVDLSRLLLRGANPKAGLSVLDQAPASQQKTVEYLTARNRILLALDNKPEVRKNLDSALAVARTPDLLYQDALLRITQKDYAGGRNSLESLLKQDPENIAALQLLAVSYLAESKIDKALNTLQDASSQRPKSAPLRTLWGIWLAKAGRRGEARTALVEAMNLDSHYLLPALTLAQMDYENGDLDGARRKLTPIVTNQPELVRATLLLAMTETRAGNRPAAIKLFRAVIERDPKNEDALNDLAYLLAGEQPDEALKYAQSALELAPDSSAALDTLGWVYYRKGVYHSALDYFKRAFAKEATATCQYHLGLAYAKLGDARLARYNVSAALLKEPALAAEQ